MTNRELLLSLKTYEEFDKAREQFTNGDFVDEDVRKHINKLFGKGHAPKKMHVDIPMTKENVLLFIGDDEEEYTIE